jgi:LPXTG-motif cell wall-anchored protein
MKLTGFVILIVGLGLTLVTTFKYFSNDPVVDLGTVEITKNRPHYLSWSPLVGLLIMGVGGIILLKNNKK